MTAEDCDTDDSEFAYAKINLALHVRRRLPNGYHDIETIFAFLDRGDILTVKSGEGIRLSITGPFADDLSTTENLVLDAAHLLVPYASAGMSAHIILDKRLPIASGIGGGSADAAATLRLLNRFWNTGLSRTELAELSEPLGADVPACVLSQTCRGQGIGQNLEPMENGKLRGYTVLLVNPLVPISTNSIFQLWDQVDHGPLQGENPMDIAISGGNDLQQSAERIVPKIADILTKLNQTDMRIARMSGSGATCFALYETEAKAETARKAISEIFPEAWTLIGGVR
ncbi:MAG: 4-(cytidine 5'-diphospho)-2-C-methyl-D-erythritol kinase [Parasphingorhabdus sp.]|uniref:4-(cytidine 5'-diphospho)-2-C-methyl-D-erythritol kinase n=1 Tax=Parasphingorhabdus sp. TaxID=2709688 RepID=UPI0030037A6C